MVDILLKKHYGLNVLRIEKSNVGAGSDTYFAECAEGKFVVKFPSVSEMNNPSAEPKLCEVLLDKGIDVCEFIKNKDGNYLTEDDSGRIFHVQKFIEGKVYDMNTAPDWLLKKSAEMLEISVCDYYGQYYSSAADNREIYLHQAVFSTRLMKWFEAHIGELNEALFDT